MNTEEKAKRYDEALNGMREIYPELYGAAKEYIEHFFPELAESEDERNWKSIEKAIRGFITSPIDADELLAYLEKQKEQKHPNGCFTCDEYKKGYEEGRRNGFTAGYNKAMKEVEQKEPLPIPDKFSGLKSLMLQYLQSAANRKGDTEIERDTDLWGRKILDYVWKHSDEQKEQKPVEWKPQPESLEALMYAIEGKWDVISPTSYLSRRLKDLYEGLVNTYNVDESLLSELPEAASRAYTAEDIEGLRELKRKIEASMEQKSAEKQDYSGLNDLERAILRGFLSAGVENVTVTIIKETAKECLAQMKPAEWSEVELEFRGEKVKVKRPFFRDDKGRGYSTTEQDEEVAWNALRAWCEKKGISLYDLYPKVEWSEEDSLHLTNAILSAEKEWGNESCTAKWLKFLPERFNLQPKEEWSEEDENMYKAIIIALSLNSATSYLRSWGITLEDADSWLKSLSSCPKSSDNWKPSEEQMSMLLAVINDPNNAGAESCYMALKSIYNNLKKL